MSAKIPKPSVDELTELYGQVGSTISSMAKHYNTSQPTVRKWLIGYGIQRKSHEESSKQANKKNAGVKRNTQAHMILSDELWLRNQLSQRNVGIETVAKMAGCSPTIVKRYVKQYGILPANKVFHTNEAAQLYQDGSKVREVAISLDVSTATVSRWLNSDPNFEPRPTNSYEKVFRRRSQAELDICAFIESLGIPVETNAKIAGTEFDIVIPGKMLAIEFNGLYYHTEEFKHGKDFHLNKTRTAALNGYQLFHVFEDSWRDKQDIIKSMIVHKLGCTARTVYARQTVVKSVDQPTRQAFLIKNHLKGCDSSTHSFGLFKNDELVSLMTFRSPRFNRKHDWELVRYAVKQDTSVVGSFSKLLKRFRSEYPGSIISYSDVSYSEGNVYEKNGFVYVTTNAPSYWYVNRSSQNRFPRTYFTKKKLLKLSGLSIDHTEAQMAAAIGLRRIWDCGTIQWILPAVAAS